MQNKFYSLFIISTIYIIAIAAGIFTAAVLRESTHAILALFIADIAATVVIFIFSLILSNASVYDPYWSVVPLPLAAGYYLLTGAEFSAFHLIILIPLLFWTVRLTYNWIRGFDNLKWIDWRYAGFKAKFPRAYHFISFTGIMLMPTCLVFAGMIPFYFLITGSVNLFTFIIGGSIVLGAALYQAISDKQKLEWRKSADKAECIDTGLWRYSRHPNYFGEIMLWWGIFICSFNNFNWLSPAGAVLITLLFFFVSIPMMEKHIKESRPGYQNYSSVVRSPIIPFFRKK